MVKKIITFFTCFILAAMLMQSCKKDEPEKEVTGPVVFTISPVDTASISVATPLGNINPPGHTFPTNHIYFYMRGTTPIEVYSIGEGVIISVQYHDMSDDNSILIKYSSTCQYYYDHVSNLPEYIEEGFILSPELLMGYSNPLTAALDLGVIDFDVTNAFINQDRYFENFLNCGNPYLYFTDSVRNILYGKNSRTAEPRGGKIDYDLDGTLAGNWFLEGTPVHILNATHDYMESQLTFVYDMWDPNKIIIAAGGTLDLSPFISPVTGNSPDPGDVTPSSGKVKYRLSAFLVNGTMLVQMLENGRIKVEVFPGLEIDNVDDFTSNAKFYTR